MLAGPQIRRLRERQAVPVLFVKAASGVYAVEGTLISNALIVPVALSNRAEHP